MYSGLRDVFIHTGVYAAAILLGEHAGVKRAPPMFTGYLKLFYVCSLRTKTIRQTHLHHGEKWPVASQRGPERVIYRRCCIGTYGACHFTSMCCCASCGPEHADGFLGGCCKEEHVTGNRDGMGTITTVSIKRVPAVSSTIDLHNINACVDVATTTPTIRQGRLRFLTVQYSTVVFGFVVGGVHRHDYP